VTLADECIAKDCYKWCDDSGSKQFCNPLGFGHNMNKIRDVINWYHCQSSSVNLVHEILTDLKLLKEKGYQKE
jgi:hypothetical protein